MFRVVVVCAALFSLSAGAGELADPMEPPEYRDREKPVAKKPPTVHYTLTSTFIAPERRVAIINGRRVSEGDWVGGARVVEIQPSSVRLVRRGRAYRLSLVPLATKRPVANE